MKKINLRGISEILSEKELKNVMGGSNTGCPAQSSSCSGNCTISAGGKTFSGTCTSVSLGGTALCACVEN